MRLGKDDARAPVRRRGSDASFRHTSDVFAVPTGEDVGEEALNFVWVIFATHVRASQDGRPEKKGLPGVWLKPTGRSRPRRPVPRNTGKDGGIMPFNSNFKKKKNCTIKTRPRHAFEKRPPAPRKPKGKPGRPFFGARGGGSNLTFKLLPGCVNSSFL